MWPVRVGLSPDPETVMHLMACHALEVMFKMKYVQQMFVQVKSFSCFLTVILIWLCADCLEAMKELQIRTPAINFFGDVSMVFCNSSAFCCDTGNLKSNEPGNDFFDSDNSQDDIEILDECNLAAPIEMNEVTVLVHGTDDWTAYYIRAKMTSNEEFMYVNCNSIFWAFWGMFFCDKLGAFLIPALGRTLSLWIAGSAETLLCKKVLSSGKTIHLIKNRKYLMITLNA